MIDIHAHILPGIDDGSFDIEETMEMLRQAARAGTRTILATPHTNTGGYFPDRTPEEIRQNYQALQKHIKEHDMPIHIKLGAEIYLSPDLPDLLRQKQVLTINEGKYFLVECAFDEDPDYFEDILQECRQLGYHPIIAHPERYYAVQEDARIIRHWFHQGYGIQLNKNSLVGAFGRKAEETAWYSLEHEWVSCIASDAHSARQRTTRMDETREILLKNLGYQYTRMLLEQNPYRILENQPLLTLDDIYLERQ